jgi:hypothetical protein
VTPLEVLSKTERRRDDGSPVAPEDDAAVAALLREYRAIG